ncbi:hypothetical protein CMK14_16210, partial [Candidatus Poribacteria bacterium]|nr:hypothetical protein [Candidatus Poribacteria bacterium]
MCLLLAFISLTSATAQALGPKVRQRLKRDVFSDLPNNPTMPQVQQKDLDAIKELDLTDLGDSDTPLTLEGIADHLPKLKRLDLRRTEFDNLRHLHNHPKLEALDLSELPNRPQAEIDGIFDADGGNRIRLPQLKDLNLKKTKFRRIKKLKNFTKLEKLNLSGNGISDEDFLANPDLPESAGTNEPDALEDLIQLRLLDISDNSISDARPIVRLVQRKLSISTAPGLATAPMAAQTDPDLIVIATNTQLSAAQLQQLTDLGVTIIADVHTFNLHLIKGLNMISLPLDTGDDFTAKTLAQYLVAEPTSGGKLDDGKLDDGKLD